jgi:rod shape-determining protein MreC
VGLEIACVVMIARTNSLQGNDIMNSANLGVAFWYKKQSGVANYFALGTMNDSLLNENRRLREQLARMTETDLLVDSAVTRVLPIAGDTNHKVQYAHYTYYKARVIKNAVNASINFITLNRGYKDGIGRNMPVLSGNGVVGRVVDVSAHFATVLSVLNTKQSLSSHLKDGYTGHVSWDERSGPEELIMRVLQPETVVKLGDTVWTTSYSTIFPAEIPVGTVRMIVKVEKDNSRILHLRPATNFRNLQYVYVVKDDFIEERRKLEDSTTKAFKAIK